VGRGEEFGDVGLAGDDGVDDLTVFHPHRGRVALGGESEQPPHPPAHELRHPVQQGVIGQVDDLLVQVGVAGRRRSDLGDGVQRRGDRSDRAAGGAQRLEHRRDVSARSGPPGGKRRRHRFKLAAQIKQLGGIRESERVNHRPAPRLRADEPLRFENRQRLPHGNAGHLQALGDLTLIELGPHAQLARDDLFAQHVGDTRWGLFEAHGHHSDTSTTRHLAYQTAPRQQQKPNKALFGMRK